jgi:hypothetical protein
MEIDDLDLLAQKYILDKHISTKCHNYISNYSEIFKNIRNNVKTVLEIGIGSVENGQMGGIVYLGYKTGNSLKCWSEYFVNAKIYGIDIFEHTELNCEKIQTIVADQSSEKDLFNALQIIDSKLDIIIDDGSHLAEHQVFSFIFLNKYLSENGLYIIEDIQPQNIEKFKDLSIFPSDFITYINTYFNVRYFDTRNTLGRADDFMVCFSKKII